MYENNLTFFLLYYQGDDYSNEELTLVFNIEQNRTEYSFCFSIYSLSQLHIIKKMHGLLNIHLQSNNYSLDGIKFTIVLEF